MFVVCIHRCESDAYINERTQLRLPSCGSCIRAFWYKGFKMIHQWMYAAMVAIHATIGAACFSVPGVEPRDRLCSIELGMLSSLAVVCGLNK